MSVSSSSRLPVLRLLAIGMMLFALFFGAGNLIFPAMLGQQAGQSLAPAIIGFLLTGVGLPLAGVVALGLSGARDLQELSARLHPWFGVAFTVALYLAIGPLFAIPRTAAVSYELGVAYWLPKDGNKAAEVGFLLGFMALALWLALSPGKLVDRIGKILTPLLLLAMAILIVASIINPMGELGAVQQMYQQKPLLTGFLAGYETMDALAALVFGILVLQAIRAVGVEEVGPVARATLSAGLVAAALLTVVYVFIARMGALSVDVLGVRENGAQVLSGVAAHYYGDAGAALLGVMVFLACLTTAVGLIASCAAYFSRLLPMFSYRVWACVFAVVSFAVAQFGLSTILSAAVPVLVFLYPLTIVLVGLVFAEYFFGMAPVVQRWVMAGTVLASALHALAGFKLLPQSLTAPLARIYGWESGMGWVVFALAGLLLGLSVHVVTARPDR